MSDTGLARIASGDVLPKIPVVPSNGQWSKDSATELDNYFRNLNNYLRRLHLRLTDQNIFSSEFSRTEDENFFHEAPTNKPYTLIEYLEWPVEIVRFTHRVTSGSCTLGLTVDGGAIVGVGNAVSGPNQHQVTFDAEFATIGQRLDLVVSNAGASVNLSVTVKLVKTVGDVRVRR